MLILSLPYPSRDTGGLGYSQVFKPTVLPYYGVTTISVPANPVRSQESNFIIFRSKYV